MACCGTAAGDPIFTATLQLQQQDDCRKQATCWRSGAMLGSAVDRVCNNVATDRRLRCQGIRNDLMSGNS